MTDSVSSSTYVPLTQQNVDIQTDNLQRVLMFVQLTRANTLNTQLTSDASVLEERNEVLKEANLALAAARQAKEDAADDSDDDDDSEVTNETSYPDYYDFRTKYNIDRDTSGNDTAHTQDEWDVNIEHLKTFIDNLNSNADLDMARLQEITNKHSQAFELLTTFLQKSNQAMSTILQIR